MEQHTWTRQRTTFCCRRWWVRGRRRPAETLPHACSPSVAFSTPKSCRRSEEVSQPRRYHPSSSLVRDLTHNSDARRSAVRGNSDYTWSEPVRLTLIVLNDSDRTKKKDISRWSKSPVVGLAHTSHIPIRHDGVISSWAGPGPEYSLSGSLLLTTERFRVADFQCHNGTNTAWNPLLDELLGLHRNPPSVNKPAPIMVIWTVVGMWRDKSADGVQNAQPKIRQLLLLIKHLKL